MISNGNYYVATGTVGNSIRKIDTGGVITTIAGTGLAGYSGDGGAATAAKLRNPQGIALDTSGNLYFADCSNNVIRRINLSTGIIITYAGTGTAGSSGDGGAAIMALLNAPNGISCDKLGNLFIADYLNYKVRKVNASGIISTAVGTSVAGYNGDGGLADTSQIRGALDVCNDGDNNLYIADESDGRIRKVDTGGIIHTVAGNGISGYGGDGGVATSASIRPHAICVDKYRNIFFSDIYTHRVRKISTSGIINTICGTGTSGYNGDSGLADTSKLKSPNYLSADTCGNIYISDGGNYRIRKVTFDTSCGRHLTDTTNHHVGVATVNSNGYSIYPNPVADVLHVDNLGTEAYYNIIDLAGKALMQGSLQSGTNSIPISELQTGMYLLQITDSYGQRSVLRISKQ